MTRATWVPTPNGETSATAYRDAVEEAVGAYSVPEDGLFLELTGGVDSRLLLAARLRSGARTRTWTVGQPDDVEMRTIEKLKGAATFEHLLVSPDAGFATELPDLIAEMHALADGEANAIVYTSLLVAFRELAGIRRTSVTGSNGELARAFYSACDRTWTAREPHPRRSDRHVGAKDLPGERRTKVGVPSRLVRPGRARPRSGHGFHPDLSVPKPGCDPRRLLSPHAHAQICRPEHQYDESFLRARGPVLRSFGSRCNSRSSGRPEAGRTRRARGDRRSFTSTRRRSAGVGRCSPAVVARAPLAGCATRDGTRAQGGGAIRRPLRKDGRSRSRGVNAISAGRGRHGVPGVRRRPSADERTPSLGLFDREALRTFVQSSLQSGSLSPLGLVLTIELTLRRFGLAV